MLSSKNETLNAKLRKLISGYECRIVSRAKEEDMLEKDRTRDIQISAIIKVLAERLPTELYNDVATQICKTAPRLKGNQQ